MKRKLLSILLTLCMVVGLFPMSAFAATPTFSDTNGHWAESAIETWAVYDVLKGSDGQFRPNDPITRAELAAVLSRVIGYTAVTNTAFSDVPSDAWYYSDVAKLYAAGIMQGDGNGTMRPNANITREEAVVLIARAFDVEENAGNENPFPDAGDISGWASFLVDGMKAEGYISGDPAGNFNPKASITRAEVVTILDNMITLYFNTAGERDCELIGEIDANALINTAGAHIKNMTINGNLWITEGVGNGDVTLENVQVSGTTYIRGGGPNSIDVIGGSLGVVVMDAQTNPHLSLSEETKIERIYLNGTSSVTHGTASVAYDEATGTMTFGGTIDQLTLNEDGTATATIGGIVYDIVPEQRAEAPKTTFALAADAVVKNMVVNAPVNVTGTGKIEKMEVHSDGVTIDKSVDVKPENITVDEGVKITIGDKEYTGDGKTLPKENTGGGGGSYNPPVTTYTITVVKMAATASYGNLAGTPTASGQSVTEAQLNALVTPGANYNIEGYYTTDNPAGTKETFPITSNTTVYVRFTGDGENTPITIATKAELAAVADDLAKDYILISDIDAGSAWVPIGNGSGSGASDMTNQFTGSFEGNGHTVNISGFAETITPGIYSRELLGLFGAVGTDGTVQNLMVTGAVSRTADVAKYIGGVAGWNTGTIQSCVVTASISSTSSNNTTNAAGGIVGINSNGGNVINCYTTGAISATSTLEVNSGGIAGYNWGIIDSCYATGAVSANGSNNFAAGIVGANGANATSIVRNCVALNSSVTESSGTAYRVTDDPTMVNNRAIEISGLSGDEGLDARNGLTITDVQSQQQSTYSTDAEWLFGTDDDNPWVWGLDPDYPLPTLYWQTTAPTIPAHLEPAKIAANAEAAKVTGFTAGTNTTTTLVFAPTVSAALDGSATVNFVSVKTGTNASDAAVTDWGASNLSLNTQKVVDNGQYEYVGITFTVTLNGATSDERTLDISALFGATTTAGKLRTDKAKFNGMTALTVASGTAGDVTVTGKTMSDGVAMAETNESGSGGFNNATIRAEAGGAVIIKFTSPSPNNGTYIFNNIPLICEGTEYTVTNDWPIAIN